MAPCTIVVQSRSGRTIETLELDTEDSVLELKKKLYRIKKNLYPSRQRFSLPAAPDGKGQVLEDGKKLSDYKITGSAVVVFKDLGPQVGYATVFFWEYFGPLVIYPLFYFFPQFVPFYPAKVEKRHLAQTIAVGYWCFHYAKRIYETNFVHRFGHETMPIFNLFKNCSYYWGFAAVIAYFVNHQLYTPPSETQTLICFGLALVCQAINYKCHVMLANLRKPGEKGYKIPRGFLFESITCPNYTAEIWGWTLFSLGTQTAAAAAFTVAGAYQMVMWAIQKHKRLRKTFDGKDGKEKYPRRWIVLPPFL